MIELSNYPHSSPSGATWDSSGKPAGLASGNNPPRPSSASLYVASMMTEDAWRVVCMLERADEVCARHYAAYGFEAEDAAREIFRARILQPQGDAAAKTKIWSIEDIVGEGGTKRSASPEQPEPVAKKFCTYGAAESAQASSVGPPEYGHSSRVVPTDYGHSSKVVPTDYGHSSAVGSSGHDQRWLDTRLPTQSSVESADHAPLSQLMLQEMAGDYCCRYVEQLFRNGMYVYKCVYCNQRFASTQQVCQHQTLVHPFAK